MRSLQFGVLITAVLGFGTAMPSLAFAQSAPTPTEAASIIVANTEASALLPDELMAAQRIGADVRQQLLSGAIGAREDEAADFQALIALYESRADEPLFVGESGYTPKGQALIEELSKADEWGLNPSDFQVASLGQQSPDRPALSRDQRVDAEMRLGLAILKYARHARGGRITEPAKQLSSYLDRTPQYVDPKNFLDRIAVSDDPADVLRSTHPRHAQFEHLRQRYLDLKKNIDAARQIVRLPAQGPNLIPGQSHADVALLRQRLDVPVAAQPDGTPGDETFYDDALAAAVAKFQSEKGVKADGIVGRRTRAALNDISLPDPERILANMEMWRWMPEDLGETYVWVNIPEFLVRVVKRGEIIHEERIITGEVSKQTPVFSDAISTIYFNPRWHVPQSIKVRELYPSLARGGGAFQKQGLRLMRNGKYVDPASVDWSKADIRAYDVYQPSGPGNALGVVKFTFPNKHAVYLHDTPGKDLFNATTRTFSHGCMRVRNPMRLAEILLETDKGWDAGQVHATQRSNADEVAVQLTRPIPVHITYLTMLVGEDGAERVTRDVYGHEERVRLALAGRFDRIARGPDHLAPVKFERIQVVDSPDDWGLFFGGGAQSGTQKRYKQNNSALNEFFNNLFGF